jgi:hypothetical protein
MSEIRYFRASPAVYAEIGAQLDAAYGYPSADMKTLRTLPLASDLRQDADGRVYLFISAEYCNYILPSQMLPDLLASGAVEELTAEQWLAIWPPWTP